jgi:hypothetical protein
MTEEYQSIMKNEVWDIVPKPKNKDVVSSIWLFEIKHAVDGSIEKYKAIFVARGFSQKESIDYEETFALMARYSSIRTIIALAAKMKWKLHQMDMKTTFLNGVTEEEVYMEQPQGFEVENRKSHVYRLKKALYGLKQAPRAWYGRIDSFLTSLGFTNSEVDLNLYFKIMNNEPVILLLYVDDLFLTREEKLITECKRRLASEYEMKDRGLMHYFSLGSAMILWQSRKQSSIALSTAEVEYIATCSASCEAIWLRKLLTDLFDLEMRATVILCDNQSCIKMTENPVFHDRSKHIEFRYHYIRDMVQRGALKLQYISMDEHVADVLTKPLSHVNFEYFEISLT